MKKKQVSFHFAKGRCFGSVLSCVDCAAEFKGDDYKAHNECMREEQKYGPLGRNSVVEMSKNQKKQQNWFDIVNRAIHMSEVDQPVSCKRLLSTLCDYPRAPEGKSGSWELPKYPKEKAKVH